MKLRHLITMSMGFENPMLMGAMRPKMVEKDWVKFVLNAKVVHEPGTVFQYNNAGPYLLGILVQRKTGMSLVDYLMPRLFEPLGIARPECEKDPLGNTFGAGGLQLNVSEFAKLGLLYLQRGSGTAGSSSRNSGSRKQEVRRSSPIREMTRSAATTDTSSGRCRTVHSVQTASMGSIASFCPRRTRSSPSTRCRSRTKKKCSAPLSEPCFLCYNKGRQTPERMEHPWNTERWNMSLSLHRRKPLQSGRTAVHLSTCAEPLPCQAGTGAWHAAVRAEESAVHPHDGRRIVSGHGAGDPLPAAAV